MLKRARFAALVTVPTALVLVCACCRADQHGAPADLSRAFEGTAMGVLVGLVMALVTARLPEGRVAGVAHGAATGAALGLVGGLLSHMGYYGWAVGALIFAVPGAGLGLFVSPFAHELVRCLDAGTAAQRTFYRSLTIGLYAVVVGLLWMGANLL